MDNSARRVVVQRNFGTRVLQVQERKQWKRKNLDTISENLNSVTAVKSKVNQWTVREIWLATLKISIAK